MTLKILHIRITLLLQNILTKPAIRYGIAEDVGIDKEDIGKSLDNNFNITVLLENGNLYRLSGKKSQ